VNIHIYIFFIFERLQVQTSFPRLPIVTLSMLHSFPQNKCQNCSSKYEFMSKTSCHLFAIYYYFNYCPYQDTLCSAWGRICKLKAIMWVYITQISH